MTGQIPLFSYRFLIKLYSSSSITRSRKAATSTKFRHTYYITLRTVLFCGQAKIWFVSCEPTSHFGNTSFIFGSTGSGDYYISSLHVSERIWNNTQRILLGSFLSEPNGRSWESTQNYIRAVCIVLGNFFNESVLSC